MAFQSILFLHAADLMAGEVPEPACFRDLNLDQLVRAATAGREAYHLEGWYRRLLGDVDAVAFRHEVLAALGDAALRDPVNRFCGELRGVRQQLEAAAKHREARQAQRGRLAAALRYCATLEALDSALRPLQLPARGLQSFRDHLAGLLRSAPFQRLAGTARATKAALDGVHYDMHVFGSAIIVRSHEGGSDYGAEVAATFDRFRHRPAKDYRVDLPAFEDLNHVEAEVLDRVARLDPEPFRLLADFAVANPAFLDEGVARFDREVQFYLGWLELTDRFARAGLTTCLPDLSTTRRSIEVRGAFDAALAARQAGGSVVIVPNDVLLRGRERLMVVTGPNHGGKTTFARMVGQLHWLAALGLSVPAAEAHLPLCDGVATHFERREEAASDRGKLRDDLVRIRAILAGAGPRTVVILNEVFASTTLEDAVFLSQEVMRRLSDLDLVAVCVTFLAELASFDGKTVSYVGNVDPADPDVRTFKVVRRPADGLAHALAVAEKHRVTERWLERRMTP